jgi:hypothetical protein
LSGRPEAKCGVYTRANGTIVNGTRAPFSNAIASDGYFAAMGNSNYNALLLTLKPTKNSRVLQIMKRAHILEEEIGHAKRHQGKHAMG